MLLQALYCNHRGKLLYCKCQRWVAMLGCHCYIAQMQTTWLRETLIRDENSSHENLGKEGQRNSSSEIHKTSQLSWKMLSLNIWRIKLLSCSHEWNQSHLCHMYDIMLLRDCLTETTGLGTLHPRFSCGNQVTTSIKTWLLTLACRWPTRQASSADLPGVLAPDREQLLQLAAGQLWEPSCSWVSHLDPASWHAIATLYRYSLMRGWVWCRGQVYPCRRTRRVLNHTVIITDWDRVPVLFTCDQLTVLFTCDQKVMPQGPQAGL